MVDVDPLVIVFVLEKKKYIIRHLPNLNQLHGDTFDPIPRPFWRMSITQRLCNIVQQVEQQAGIFYKYSEALVAWALIYSTSNVTRRGGTRRQVHLTCTCKSR